MKKTLLKAENDLYGIQTLQRARAEIIRLRKELKAMKGEKASLEKRKICICETSQINIFEPDQILRCRACSNYTQIFLISGKTLMVSTTLKKIALPLRNAGFLRTHRTHLVNPNYIQKIIKGKDFILQLLQSRIRENNAGQIIIKRIIKYLMMKNYKSLRQYGRSLLKGHCTLLLLLCVTISYPRLHAQRLVTQSVGALGFAPSDDNGSTLHWNVGEVITAKTSGTPRLNQGLYQVIRISTSTEEKDNIKIFDAYPNPCSGMLYVQSSRPVTLDLVDTRGRLVKEAMEWDGALTKLDLSGYPVGVYYLRARKGKEIIQIKKLLIFP